MRKFVKKSIAAITVLSLMTLGLILAGCGSSGGELSSQVVSGNASVGAPLVGKVSLKDSSSTALVRTTTIGSDGSFAIDVTGMQAPFILEATGTAAGSNYKLHSFADGAGTANINPLSDAIVASAAGDDDAAHTYEHSDRDTLHKISSNLQKTITALLTKLQPLLQQYSAQNTNPITAQYISNHLGLDEMFDNVKITVLNGNLSIINTKTGAVIFTGSLSDIANGVFTGGTLPPTPAVPAAPTNLSATGGTGQVTLSWTSVSGATSYNLYYATTSGVTTTSGTKITSVSSPYIQTALAAGTSYYYIVTAVNSTGESSASAQASAGTASAPPVPTIPAAPSVVSATGGTNQVTLTWGAVSTATSYNVYYSTTSGVTKANGTKIANATSPAVQPGLIAATTYYYIVTAVNSTGESAASAQVSATTLSSTPTPTAPAAPTGVTATGGTNQVSLSWPSVSGATSYNIYYATTSGVTKTNGAKITNAATPYTQTGLAAGTTYYYVVTAVNSTGESAASPQASATTATAAPAFDALAYYNSVCLGCHGSLGVRTATQITSAIANVGSMKSLSTLTAAQIAAIAAVSY